MVAADLNLKFAGRIVGDDLVGLKPFQVLRPRAAQCVVGWQ
jgi:hypothetical protein